jgi:hypothetical protein
MYKLTIKPAIEQDERYKIEDVLMSLGYKIGMIGTTTDKSECHISFEKIQKD